MVYLDDTGLVHPLGAADKATGASQNQRGIPLAELDTLSGQLYVLGVVG